MKKLTISFAACALLALGACGGGAKPEDAKVAKADTPKPADAKADAAKPADEEKKPADDAAAAPPPFTHIAFGRMKVKDVAQYKAEFAKGEDARTDAGVKMHWIDEDAADPKVLMVSVAVQGGLDKLKAHLDSDMVKTAHEAVLDGAPEFMLLGELKHATEPPAGQKPAGDLFVAHEVADFAKWLEAFKAHAKARTDASVIAEGVVLAEDGKTVGIHLAYTDDAKIKAFAASDDLKKVMADAGVQGAPKMFWGKPVEEKAYGPTAVAQK